jgi:hypothetical protein
MRVRAGDATDVACQLSTLAIADTRYSADYLDRLVPAATNINQPVADIEAMLQQLDSRLTFCGKIPRRVHFIFFSDKPMPDSGIFCWQSLPLQSRLADFAVELQSHP